MKLIKTKLLQKYNHNSAAGIATASHIDFCRYQVSCLKPEWSYNEYVNCFTMFIYSIFGLLTIPVLVLTNGLILYPFWIVVHIFKVKQIAKEFGVSKINKSAEKLVKEMSEKKNDSRTI